MYTGRRGVFNESVISTRTVQGEPKKCPNTKITISQKNGNIFVLNFAHLFKTQLCDKCVDLRRIYLTYAKVTETQTFRTNFATVQAG